MSLNVYLTMPHTVTVANEAAPNHTIFIRENGRRKRISREEWDLRFPEHEPVCVVLTHENLQNRVYESNITHNLNMMAKAAGIYEHLWSPDEIGIDTAGQLIRPLRDGLEKLKADPERFWVFNPRNGWGSYEGLVSFVEEYLAACEQWPKAKVRVSR